MLAPFALDSLQYLLIEKFLEIISRDTHVYIVVHLNGDTYTVAASYTEAT